MVSRSEFLKSIATIAAGGLVMPQFAERLAGTDKIKLDKIGVQLFTIPKLLQNDFEGTIKLLASIGYKEVEFFGPYPFSTDAVKKSWAPIGKQLGLTGSGYFGHTVHEVKQILSSNGITTPSMHVQLETLQQNLEEVAEAAHVLGQQYAGLPMIQEDKRKTLEDWKRLADEFNTLGERMSDVGLNFFYHNHGCGLKEVNGQVPFEVLLERTNPEFVSMEMDIYWTVAGGGNPIALLDKYKGRYKLMHIKDMSKKIAFSGQGCGPAQFEALFPYMVDPGTGKGVLDLQAILSHALKSGVRYFYVEHDLASDPDKTLRDNYNYLSQLDLNY